MKFVAGSKKDRISIALCEELGIDPNLVSRIVIDLKVGDPARVYWSTYADDKALDVFLEGDLKLVSSEDEA